MMTTLARTPMNREQVDTDDRQKNGGKKMRPQRSRDLVSPSSRFPNELTDYARDDPNDGETPLYSEEIETCETSVSSPPDESKPTPVCNGRVESNLGKRENVKVYQTCPDRGSKLLQHGYHDCPSKPGDFGYRLRHISI